MATERSYEQVSVEGTEFCKVDEKAASVPIFAQSPPEETKVKTQVSSPSYLFSLKDNEAPPFKKPGKEAKPHLVIGTLVNEDEVISMIAASEEDPINGLSSYIGKLLVEKKLIVSYNRSEKNFLISLLKETIDYAAQRDFNAYQLACLLTLYLTTHMYFKWYYWSSPASVWSYFKELMIRHTIEDSPEAVHVFEAEECYDILTHFHTAYMNNLPLVHILTFGDHMLKFVWPYKSK